MLRTFTAGFLARAALASVSFLLCFSLVAAKDEMTSGLLIGNARIDIRIEGSTLRLPAKDIFRWVRSAAESVTAYYGRFPVPQLLIRITPFEGRGVPTRMAFAPPPAPITTPLATQPPPSTSPPAS